MRLSSVTVLVLAGIFSAGFVTSQKTCPRGQPSEPLQMEDEDAPVSIFDDLTKPEMDNVISYLANQDELHLEQNLERATPQSSYIYLIEALPPVKSEAVAFLNGQGPRPARYAKVILFRGDLSPPQVTELKVGPLPAPTSYEAITHPDWNPTVIPYYMRSLFSDVEVRLWLSFLERELSTIDHILEEHTGYRYTDCGQRCLHWFPSTPGSFESGARKMWIALMRKVEGYYLHPVGFQMRINAAELNNTNWYAESIWFRGDTFDSLLEFRKNFEGQSRTSPREHLFYEDSDPNLYSALKQKGAPIPEEPQRGPQQILPDGRRWKVQGHQVEWQGWSLDFNMRSQLGTQIHNVKFQGHSVAYEVSLSEIGVLYSGHSPQPLHTAYVDSLFQFGREMYTLVPGADCPQFATYFDFVHYLGFGPLIYKNAVCVFEWDRGLPLRRHYDSDHYKSYYFYQTMPDNVLILRSMVTAYNYEYMLDYMFHQNGVLEVKTSLSGYVLSSYYTGPEEDKYGFEIFKGGIGNIHNHLIHFKADLDVDGPSNRFETLDVGVESKRDTWERRNRNINARTITRNLRRTERNATINFSLDSPRYLLIQNSRTTNSFGNPKGYRIIPQDMSKILLPEGEDVELAFTWARHQVAVTKRHEWEDSASNVYASLDQMNPLFTFQDFIDDNENIVDEDLIAWVTLGAFHIPHSEDVPIVQTPSVQLTFLLQPYNFFDTDPSLRSRDNIRSTPAQDGSHQMEYVGVNTDADLDCLPDNGQAESSAVENTISMTTALAIVSLLALFV